MLFIIFIMLNLACLLKEFLEFYLEDSNEFDYLSFQWYFVTFAIFVVIVAITDKGFNYYKLGYWGEFAFTVIKKKE